MSSEEQTVLEALAAGSHCDCVGGYVERGLVSPSCWLHNDAEDALDLIGIDPDMSVSRLREDLAIAARVRSVVVDGRDVIHPVVDERYPQGAYDYRTGSACNLLAFLRRDAT